MAVDPFILDIKVDDYELHVDLESLADWNLRNYRKMLRLLFAPRNSVPDGPKILGLYLESKFRSSKEIWAQESQIYAHGWKYVPNPRARDPQTLETLKRNAELKASLAKAKRLHERYDLLRNIFNELKGSKAL